MPNALGLLAEPQMRATPRNKLMGLLADFLSGGTTPDPSMPMGVKNPALGLLDYVLPVQSAAKTLDRMSYGEPLTNNVRGSKPLLKPETADVAMMAPLSPRNALAMLGMADTGAAKAIFAGIGAKTADKAALAKAEQLAAKGADPKAIWRDTGWFKGGDGKWRFEIDDSKAKVLKTFKSDAGEDAINLDDAISHATLYAAYPDASTMGARHMNFGPAKGATFGGYNSTKDTVVMNSAHPMFKDAAAVRSGMLHEIQHGIQQREGMGLGGKLDGGLDEYRRLAGESEARAVQARMGLTAKQRRELFPLDSFDVPAASLIYR